MQRLKAVVLILILGSANVGANNSDVFNYGMSNKNENGDSSYGQPDWDRTTCSNINTCTGYPNKFPHAMGFTIAGENQCQWCPKGGPQNCGLHRQSPINLERDRSVPGSPNEKECIDWHWMMYEEGACNWNDMKDQFTIERHALQLHIPQLSNGDIDCIKNGQRFYPRLDYSKGFPNWWWMQRVDVMVPSQHIQEGVQYAAEVTLAHFYEKAHAKNHLGHIAIFLQDYPDEPSWPFLDKLLCSWRKVEEETRKACGLPPAPPYGRCELFRGQQPTTEWLIEAGIIIDAAESDDDVPTTRATDSPTAGPTSSPTPRPSPSPTPDPTVPPTPSPTKSPTKAPTKSPTKPPTKSPTSSPTKGPIESPTQTPSDSPAVSATEEPSSEPSSEPSVRHGADLPERDSTPAPVASPTAIPSTAPIPSPTPEPTLSPTSNPTSMPTSNPTSKPTSIPTSLPTATPTTTPTVLIEAAEESIECGSYDVNYSRMCFSKDPCCEGVRSDTSYCWDIYENIFPGSLIGPACSQCCPGKRVGPANPAIAELPKTIQCSAVGNPKRLCKPNSCCSNPRSTSNYCKNAYARYGDDMSQICHYCCREPKEIGPARRSLRSSSNLTFDEEWDSSDFDDMDDEEEDENFFDARSHVPNDSAKESVTAIQDPSEEALSHEDDLREGDKVHYVSGQKYIVREENFRESTEDDEEYFDRIYTDFKRRHRHLSGVIHDENYDDVEFSTYEWMLKVETEYYFRYEGTMLVPPCWDVVHWRAMKDPLRVHSRQIAELHRLLAWRVNADTCNKETAGVVSSDGNTIELNREVQYYHTQHRKVFCECKDWPSKFQNDREWCHRWDEDVNHDRFYTRPYSFDSDGQWLPTSP